jgi:hypothetical protein
MELHGRTRARHVNAEWRLTAGVGVVWWGFATAASPLTFAKLASLEHRYSKSNCPSLSWTRKQDTPVRRERKHRRALRGGSFLAFAAQQPSGLHGADHRAQASGMIAHLVPVLPLISGFGCVLVPWMLR